MSERSESNASNGSCPWVEKFNALPKEVRTIGAALEAKTRIQHLNLEKRRLKSNYQKSCREIDQHIASGVERLDDRHKRLSDTDRAARGWAAGSSQRRHQLEPIIV